MGKVATTVHRGPDGLYTMVYHSTPVVRWNDEHCYLDSGGYQTKTTKKRMNEASGDFSLGFRVFAKDFAWYVENLATGQTVEFEDGMDLAAAFTEES